MLMRKRTKEGDKIFLTEFSWAHKESGTSKPFTVLRRITAVGASIEIDLNEHRSTKDIRNMTLGDNNYYAETLQALTIKKDIDKLEG